LPRLAGDRVGPDVDDDPERAAGELLYVTLTVAVFATEGR
jgi:hypothetical protein